MKHVMTHSTRWVLLLLVLVAALSHVGSSRRLSRQVIVVLGDDPVVLRSAKFLFDKNKGISQVIKLNNDANNCNGWSYCNMIWSEGKLKYDKYHDALPKTREQWSSTHIQIVGLGKEDLLKVGNLSPEILKAKLIRVTHSYAVGWISLVVCNGNGATIEKHSANLDVFLTSLTQENTVVSFQSALEYVDEGQIKKGIFVKLVNVIEWRPKDRSKKWIVDYKLKTIKELATNAPDMESYYFGILPLNMPVYVILINEHEYFEITDHYIYTLIDKIANETYSSLNPAHRSNPRKRNVYLFDGQNSKLEVREFKSINDLLTELQYFDYRYDGSWSLVYYRFGDWIVEMRTDTFYVKVVGIIVSDNDRIAQIRNSWDEIPPEYNKMREGIDETTFIKDVHHWINGENSQIELTRKSAFNAQCAMAMFMSEAIRCFHVHITNMMSLQLIDKDYMNIDLLFSTHPMAHGGTWQVTYPNTNRKKTGTRMLEDDKMAYNELKWKSKTYKKNYDVKFDRIKTSISRISKTWLSHQFDNNDLIGSWEQPQLSQVLHEHKMDIILKAFPRIFFPKSSDRLKNIQANRPVSIKELIAPSSSKRFRDEF